MTSEMVILLNAVLYSIVLLYFIHKYKFSVGVVIWGLYVFAAWATFLFVQHPYYSTGIHYSKQTLFPYLYMFVINLIAMFPLAKLKSIPNVIITKQKIVNLIMIVCCLLYLLFIVIDLPNMVKIITSPASMLSAIRDSGYDANSSLVEANPLLNKIYLLFSGMRILSSGLSVYLLLTYKKHRGLVWLFFILTTGNNIRIIINQAGRGEIVLLFLLYACLFYSLREHISSRKIVLALIALIPVFVVAISFFWAVTISRFGQYAEYSMYKYIGEPMNNFNGLLFNKIEGYTYGRAYFSVLYRYLFGQEDFISTAEKWALINQMTGINGSLFYTWIGGLIIEFGKVVPLFVACFLNRMVTHLCTLEDYRIGDLFVIIFFVNFYLRGVFFFPTQNFEGVFMILYTIFLYFIFRIRKNGKGKVVYMLPRSHGRRKRLR